MPNALISAIALFRVLLPLTGANFNVTPGVTPTLAVMGVNTGLKFTVVFALKSPLATLNEFVVGLLTVVLVLAFIVPVSYTHLTLPTNREV